MTSEAVDLIAMLVTLSLLAYGAAVALAAVDWLLNGRADWRTALGALLQHGGTATSLVGLVYRQEMIALIGLLLVTLSILVAGLYRRPAVPQFETVLTVLTLVNLVSLTIFYAA